MGKQGKKKQKNIKQKIDNRKTVRQLKWQNLKIGKKYISVFILTALLFLVSGTVVYFQLNAGKQDIDTIKQRSERSADMAKMAEIVQAKDVQIADYIITKNEKYIDEFNNYQAKLEKLQKKIEPKMDTEKQKNLLNMINKTNTKVNEIFLEKITASVANNQDYMSRSLRDQSSTLRMKNSQRIENLMKTVEQAQQAAVKDAKSKMNKSTGTLAIVNLLAIAIGILLILLVSRRISASLGNIVMMTKEMAKGNLTVHSFNYKGNDEIGQLSHAINQMRENMTSVLSKVNLAAQSVAGRGEDLTQSANEVKEGNEQIATTMEELSTGAETQANSASDLTESMNDFVQKVNQSDQSGQEINKKSNEVLDLTTEGTELMKKSVEQMERIDAIVSEAVDKVQGLDKQSDQISKLVLVIKDIADQTNLLSLNAAIEAARAGEHGKGFAVVADEVRKLAEQVSNSVTEITTIVTRIQSETDHVVDSLNSGYSEVKEGTNQIEATGRNFETIRSSVSDMVQKAADISANLRTIAAGSNDMNNLIEEIASVSEESAAGVEQAAASAEETSNSMEKVSNSADELAELAEQLNEELKIFKL